MSAFLLCADGLRGIKFNNWTGCSGGLTASHHIIYGAHESIGKLAACLVGVDGVALGGGGVEAYGGEVRALQYQDGSATAGVIGVGIGGDKEFGKVADDKYDVFDIGLCGKKFKQTVANCS